MLVYGDHWRTVRPSERLAELRRIIQAPDDPERLTHALIAAGELAQALADQEFEALGQDHLTDRQSAAMALCTALARRLFCGGASGQVELAALERQPMPPVLRCKVPEGFAFYAVHPEAYAAAARSHAWSRPPLVIGLRSIGTSLAAVVAAVTDGEAVTVRPQGHPFAREILASEALRDRLRDHLGPFAVVDEGPGLSGSSFGAVADLLEELGATADRIVFIPSHAGAPGSRASDHHRARWASAIRVHRTLDDLMAGDPLETWFSDLIGPVQRMEDISGGAWRRELPEASWPPAFAGQERRKFRLTTEHGVFVARFAGLGAIGQQKFERAQRLFQGGFSPEPLALRRGFLLDPWIAGMPAGREAILARLPGYLAFRAHELPAGDPGASLETLQEMAVHNARELCGQDIAWRLQERLDQAVGQLPDLRPVHVDARLHPWEWRMDPHGRLWKTDAVDHAEAHDLIGPQDIAWDVAGAVVEYDLQPAAAQELAAGISSPPAIEAFGICYAAFQGGLWAMAEAQAWGDEVVPIQRHRRRYKTYLRATAGEPVATDAASARGLHA